MADFAQDSEEYAVEGIPAVATTQLADVQYRHQSVSQSLLES